MNDQEYRRVNSSIAWFKLADLVIRREREKALNVYRLLFHSLDNKAYALQLEGDLLWFFDDTLCLKKYEEAAQQYELVQRWIDAFALYEQMYYYDRSGELLPALLRTALFAHHEKKCREIFAKIKELFDDGIITDYQFKEIINQIFQLVQDHAERRELVCWLVSCIAELHHHLPELVQAELRQLSE